MLCLGHEKARSVHGEQHAAHLHQNSFCAWDAESQKITYVSTRRRLLLCVCMRQREKWEGGGERERLRECLCLFVCMWCVFVCVCV
jgi:hypothetical protein